MRSNRLDWFADREWFLFARKLRGETVRRGSFFASVTALTSIGLMRSTSVVPFGEREWHAAITAFLRFGRGRHAAGLNFGDCLAYGAASAADDSLLFVGDYFAGTDIARA